MNIDYMQISLIEEVPETFSNKDDYETPSWLGREMAALIKPTDRRICEPAAGAGQIAQFLPKDRTTLFEINPLRVDYGVKQHGLTYRRPCDFLSMRPENGTWDVFTTNPPFSLAIEFIRKGLELLNPDYPEARLLYLLPHDFDQAIGRNKELQESNCHIHHVYKVIDRIAYLKNGVPVKGRQIYDAIYDIRPGKEGSVVSYIKRFDTFI